MSSDITAIDLARMPQTGVPQDETSDLTIYWRSIAKRKWMILGLAVVVTGLTAFAVSLQTPIYRSTSTLLIEQNRARVAPTEEVYASSGDSREHFQTQAEILKSRALAVKVVDELGLGTHPDFDPRQQKPGRLAELKQWVGLATERPVWTDEAAREYAIGSLMNRMNVEPVRLSQLIKISFESADASTAAVIANTIAEVFVRSDAEGRSGMTRRASDWLGERMSGLRKTLEDSERVLQDYREKARIIDTKGLAQSGASTQIADLMGRLIAARQRRFAAEHAYQQVSEAKDHAILPVVMRNPLIVRLKEVESEAQARYSDLSTRYGPEHNRMLQAEADLRQARENIRRQVATVVASLKNEYELARSNEEALDRALTQAKGNVQNINRKEFDLVGLERAVATNRQIYELFQNRLKETKASSDVGNNPVARITDPARPGESAVRPKKEQIIAIVFILTLLIGAVIALFLERLDNTLKSADDVEDKLGQPTLTVLPLLRGAQAKALGRHYLLDPKSVFSESIRTARTSVLLSTSDAASLTVLVSSSVPGEGKSAVAINLALAEAQTKRVLLIDGDLRRPSIDTQLGLDPTKPGLTDLVAGTASFAECLQRVEGSNLYAISAGPVPLNPLELILSQRFERTIKALAGTCDMLVIDSPPVHLVSDAVVLSKHATGVVFVVKADSTPYPVVRSSLRALLDVNARLFGVMLNQLDFKKAERYYGGYYSAYGKHDGYYTKPSKALTSA